MLCNPPIIVHHQHINTYTQYYTIRPHGSCDTNHNGSLNQAEMMRLCDKLKLCPNEQRLTLSELNLDSDTVSSSVSFIVNCSVALYIYIYR